MIEVVAVLASILVLAALAAWAVSWGIGSLKDHGRVEAERDHAQGAARDADERADAATAPPARRSEASTILRDRLDRAARRLRARERGRPE